ncbi:cytidine deaminase-like protein [Jimgerdemannia flammicorona]|uniref:Cytidine deaminase-like protein n=2 Tax=Jimgerdemannia flammicorona TaxID=994334 RepID=A0A433QJE8_9FUNG|nr:cytidine deaminase-like protein [Jimgerdemannia flammicorona]RUS29902.1 cytidine deaminase-like protein [Jimgerdemannia flammicorona]
MEDTEESTQYTTDPKDLLHMREAINQANLSIAIPTAYCVGAVLTSKDGAVLSTGFSRELPGNTHAEECALTKVSGDPTAARGGTMYTTMEPCSLRLSGNRPCVERILEAGIARVVMGVREPPNFVQCNGVDLLREKGVKVCVVPGVEEDCLKPNRHVL